MFEKKNRKNREIPQNINVSGPDFGLWRVNLKSCSRKSLFKGEVQSFFYSIIDWVRIRQTKTSFNRQFSPKRPKVGQIFILRSKFSQNKDHMVDVNIEVDFHWTWVDHCRPNQQTTDWGWDLNDVILADKLLTQLFLI